MAFPGVRPAPYASLLRRGSLRRRSCTPTGTPPRSAWSTCPSPVALPAEAPAAVFVDKVDIVPPLGGSFGLHAAAVFGGRLRLLYLDREKDDRQLLKRVTEDAGGVAASSWSSRSGLPSRCSPRPDGTPAGRVGAGLPARCAALPGDRVLEPACLPRGQALPIDPGREGGPRGIHVLGRRSGALLVVLGPAAEGIQVVSVAARGPRLAMAEIAGTGSRRRDLGCREPTHPAARTRSRRRQRSARRRSRSATARAASSSRGRLRAGCSSTTRSGPPRPAGGCGSSPCFRRNRGRWDVRATFAACSRRGPRPLAGFRALSRRGDRCSCSRCARACGC